jgi:spoIIIJ-associated protein
MRLRGEEYTGRTVEEAIERGLAALHKRRSDVDIEVLEEGKPANMLGLGGEDARVLITFQEEERPEEEEQPIIDEAEVPRRPASVREDVEALEEAPPAYAEELVRGADALREILALMGMTADVVVRDRPEPQLEIEGQELGVLIGRHGENLIALQQLVSLITSRRSGRIVYVAVDIEGYRRRREQQLREIALRVAGRVRATSQAVTLEPMLAYERRIVHLALQDDRDVRTESVGVDPNRRVVVLPKRVAPGPVRPPLARPQRPFRSGPRPGYPRRPPSGGRPPGGRPPYRRPFGERP